MLFTSKKPQYEYLRKKWVARNRDSSQGLLDKHLKNIALTSLGGMMLLSAPGILPAGQVQPTDDVAKVDTSSNNNALLAAELKDKVPAEMRPLNKIEEQNIEQVLTKNLEVPVKAEIDGKRLNRSYGMIGGEQHLYRYPGDNVYAHAKTASDWAMYGGSGIAPGLGAWGYFAPSKEQFDLVAEDRERWYIAVPTFLSPGFSERVAEYRDFYKFRKMVLVNPQTGQTVITDIGDAGPAEWTGKHLGGSPEVMQELGLAGGPRKGAVLYFFVDDRENKLPLGPVHLQPHSSDGKVGVQRG